VQDYLRAIVLGALQGLTEFLPISSSAHLRIYPELLGWGDPGAAFTAVIQIGTEVAVLLYFWRDIWRIASAWLRSLVDASRRGELDARMGWYVIVGSLPIVILGIVFREWIKTEARNLWLIGTTLVVVGLLLGIADRFGRHALPISSLNMRHAVVFGAAQSCALVPGVSRSGATISAGLAMGYTREAAARYSFLLAIPAVIGAGLFELRDIPDQPNAYGPGPTVVATITAFLVGYASIAWLLRYLTTRSFAPFVIYRVALGSLVLGMLATGALEPY
jgi:undecaprenyl-diphosphatase